MNKIKVYHMDPYMLYGGFALIAAETADEANEMILDYKKHDPHNQSNSFGFCYVDELDRIYELTSSEKGIIYNRVYYSG